MSWSWIRLLPGARAYLDQSAGLRRWFVRPSKWSTGGSIWAPRRLLSKLIDRLLQGPDASQPDGVAAADRSRTPGAGTDPAGAVNREIAQQLGIEERTVKSHVGRLMRKTGADNRIEALDAALKQTLLPLGSEARQVGERHRGLLALP